MKIISVSNFQLNVYQYVRKRNHFYLVTFAPSFSPCLSFLLFSSSSSISQYSSRVVLSSGEVPPFYYGKVQFTGDSQRAPDHIQLCMSPLNIIIYDSF